MSEHKFTKGPWIFDDGWKLSKTYSSSFTGFELRVGPNSDSPHIKYDEQWRSNATLAEAAPDLFEALEPFARFACDEWGTHGCFNCIAKRAINKALGD